jgi:hypothetical protein
VARDGFGEAVGAALGDDDVGVVQETIDSRCGEAPGEDRVEARRMQVGDDDQRALLPDDAALRLTGPRVQISWPPACSSEGRGCAVLVAATVQILLSLDSGCRCRWGVRASANLVRKMVRK